MTLCLRYSAQLAAQAGVKDERLEVPPGSDVAATLARAAEQRPPSFRDMLFDADGALRSTVIVALDGCQARHDTSVDGATELLVLTPIAGG